MKTEEELLNELLKSNKLLNDQFNELREALPVGHGKCLRLFSLELIKQIQQKEASV